MTRSMWCSLSIGEALLAVLGGQHVVAVARELRGEDFAQVRLVVDDEDLLLSGSMAAPSLQGV